MNTLLDPQVAHVCVRGSPVLGLRSTTVEEFFAPVPGYKQRGAVDPPDLRPTAVLIGRGHSHASLARGRRRNSVWHLARGWHASRPLDDEETLLAVQRVLPRDAVFAGETAALVHGVDLRPPWQQGEPFRICSIRPAGHRATRRPGVRSRVMELFEGDVVRALSGIRVTSPLRTACDLAMSSTIDRATTWIEGFLRAGLITSEQLRTAVDDRRGRRGVRILRRAAQLADPRSESPQETAVRLRLLEAGLPAPDLQIEVRTGQEEPIASTTLRIDLGWPTERKPGEDGGTPGPEGGVAIEYNGAAFHPREGPAAARDATRLKVLRAHGWDVSVLVSEDLSGDERSFEIEVGRRLGRGVRAGPRAAWRPTRTNMFRNAWTRAKEPWWTRWRPPEGR